VFLVEAKQLYNKLEVTFLKAELAESKKILEQIELKLQQSKQMVRQYLLAKKQNSQRINELEAKLNQYIQLTQAELKRIIIKVKQLYHEVHYASPVADESIIHEQLKQCKQSLLFVRQLNDEQ